MPNAVSPPPRPLARPAVDFAVGGRYHLMQRIGLGGSCQVFRAWDSVERRDVAVKTPREALSAEQRERAVYQLWHEARLLAGISHPSIPSLYCYDAHVPCLVLPFLDGYPLHHALGRAVQGMPLADVCHLGRCLCAVLAYLHQQQIVFCDLTAMNVMVTTQGQIVLIDFGIAHLLREERPPLLLGLGTRGFAAPELYPGARYALSPATDIYSLGALLHYVCTGKDPSSSVRTSAPFAFPALPERIPSELARLIWRMLDRTPRRRPALGEVMHLLDTGQSRQQP